ncbi:MAG: hypothetical protein AAFR99_21815, partial [Cyanobacteria bacterium J06629_9]
GKTRNQIKIATYLYIRKPFTDKHKYLFKQEFEVFEQGKKLTNPKKCKTVFSSVKRVIPNRYQRHCNSEFFLWL